MAAEREQRKYPNSWSRGLGARIAERRLELGMTQDDLADISGVQKPMISACESGRSTPHLENFQKLCVALKIPADTLLFGIDDGTRLYSPRVRRIADRLESASDEAFEALVAVFSPNAVSDDQVEQRAPATRAMRESGLARKAANKRSAK